MKICPKCARSFADGFTYCPNDATALVKYDLRTHIQTKPELQFLLKNESLVTRLWRELRSAKEELRKNPRRYLAGLMRGERSDRRRRLLLHAGVATAVISYTAIALLVILVGLITSSHSRHVVDATPEDPKIIDGYKFVFVAAKPKEASATNNSKGFLGGSQPEPRRAHGGGGRNDGNPASAGVAPTAALLQQLRAPKLELPRIETSTLITPETIFADPKSFLKLKGPTGVPGGQTSIPSLGDGQGTGVDQGEGPGYRRGRKGGTGENDLSPGGGETTGNAIDRVRPMSRTLYPIILYKERAAYTEEARQQQVQGAVLLNVTFGADGRIHDIRVLKSLPGGLTEKAIEAAQRFKFQPAVQNGRPVSVRATIEFNFALY